MKDFSKRNFVYKGVTVNRFGIPIDLTTSKSTTVKKDKKYLNSYYSVLKKDSPKNLLVMYDVPHDKKRERDWFRRHLIRFNYIMIQKSVWIGPSPLPKDFIEYINAIGLRNKVQFFKTAKS